MRFSREGCVEFKNLVLAVIDEQHRFGSHSEGGPSEEGEFPSCFNHDRNSYSSNPKLDDIRRSRCFRL